jgi:hypothetical protein
MHIHIFFMPLLRSLLNVVASLTYNLQLWCSLFSFYILLHVHQTIRWCKYHVSLFNLWFNVGSSCPDRQQRELYLDLGFGKVVQGDWISRVVKIRDDSWPPFVAVPRQYIYCAGAQFGWFPLCADNKAFLIVWVQIQETTEEMKPAKLRSSFLHGLPGPGHAVAILWIKR